MPFHDFTSIPILDLSLSDDQVLPKLRLALADVGFLYISNHDVPSSVIDDLVQILPRLFALADETKHEIALANSPHFLGYSAAGTETTAGNLDQREQLELATELTKAPDGSPLYDRLRGPNQWPSTLPELRPIVERYMTEVTNLGERFLRLVARALSLPSDAFFPYLSDQHRLKLVHYPASSGQGVGPHKDSSGWWTFLLQASPEVGGLQVLNKSGSWVDAPAIPGTFVVNIGQAFEVVTNGVCRATTYRVLSSSRARYNVPFFQGVRRSLTRREALDSLAEHFAQFGSGDEPGEARLIDAPFVTAKYETWGETQLRTKIRSHPEIGRTFYPGVYEKYVTETCTFTTHNSNTYSYVSIQPVSRNKTILLLHGFPSTLNDWVHQIRHLSSAGYGVVAADLLGYGASSKPTEADRYRLKVMSDEVIELLDHLKLQTVVGVGHDFGATLLSRLAAYHPSRWDSFVFLAVGPPKLGTPFDVDTINQVTKQMLGYEMLGYIPWLADPSSQGMLEQHAESAMSLLFCRDRKAWGEWFHPLGKMKEFVRNDRRVPVGSWYTKDLQEAHLEAFGSTDGYKGACRWYRMWKDNLFAADETGFEDFQATQPVLFIAPAEPEQATLQQQQMLASWAPNLRTVKLDTGHWVHLERPDETSSAIQDLLLS
ncbi:hypothetical protein F66182_8543 [Fusarium sp. NRRL 66182]|nr:hypothetical protein F66182_8543 [Fusarium sp. NRRL 66182]